MTIDTKNNNYKIGASRLGFLTIYKTFQEDDNGIMFMDGKWFPYGTSMDGYYEDVFDESFTCPHKAMEYSNEHTS